MRAVYDGIGDFGVATVLAQQYGVAAQLHSDIDHEQVDAQLQQSCLAGAWTGSVARQDRVERNPDGTVSSGLSLSPGDLDETVQSFLAFNRSAEDANLNAFARVSAFRKGFQSGESACRLSDQ
jgi:predicted metalloprotease